MSTGFIYTNKETSFQRSINNSNLSCRSTSLDSLANSSHNSDSTSIESHDHDSDSGNESQSKNSFVVKCEVYKEHNEAISIKSWSKSSESLDKDENSEISYEYVSSNSSNASKTSAEKRIDLNKARMETIPEESPEPKVSVKEILARFENLRDSKAHKEKDKDKDKEVAPKEVINVCIFIHLHLITVYSLFLIFSLF